MRTPESVTWDKEVVYECTWSLLNALHNFNKDAEASGNVKIKKVVFPGLATGVGGVSAKKCAQQMAIAFKDFADACSNEEKWSNLSWGVIQKSAEETRVTHSM
jgi:O-acetyl-ADP-ribose deacetylase (regulator of RNase III)